MAKGIAEINWSDSDELQIQKTNANFRTVASPRFVMQQLNDAENQRELREFWASINEQYIHGGGGDVAEYIVASGVDETGTDPNKVSWRWIIWSSGLAECWGSSISKTSYTLSSAWGNNGIVYGPVAGMAAYPADLFDSAPFIATVEFLCEDNDAWSSYTTATTASTAPGIYLYKPTTNDNVVKGYFQYHAKGIVSADFPYNPGVSYPPDGDNLYYGTEP